MATMETQNMAQSMNINQENNEEILSNSPPDQANINQDLKLTNNLNNSHQQNSKEIVKNKLNTNSTSNANMATSTSLNEQKKKEQSDLFDDDDDILYNDEEENEIFQEYNLLNDRKLRAMDDLKNMTERIKNNKAKIEEYKRNLVELKEEKNKKKGDIMNLLSNKESIEEIYKNQIYLLNNSNYNGSSSNNINENTTLANDINNLNNLINDNSMIHLNSNHNITINDNEILNTDEDNFKIALEEIKESDQKKYIDQVINMFEDVYKKKDENINISLTNIIKNSYELFINNDKEEENEEITVNNFFAKMSLFISNQSVGKFPETKINLLLRYLLKINYIGNKLSKYIKFVNKKYKEKKKELNDMINFLEKKNINLTEKNHRLENNMKDYEDKIFFDKNVNGNDELSHEVVIEYEDGLDKNAEINYEDDLIDDNEYDMEKENEMMNKGLNPYNSNKLPQQTLYRKVSKKGKQIIVQDNDESDKYLNEFLDKKEENKTRNKYKSKNNDNLDDKNKKEDLNNQSGEMFKKIKYNNQKNIINIDKNKRLFPTPQHHIKKTDDEIKNLTTVEKEHYNRVQRIMNAGPKGNSIFGVNNYNPENTSFNGIREGNLFSPKKHSLAVPKSSNKIEKTIKIESRQNHNFIGIINMTKNVPINKKRRDTNKKSKDKEEENDKGIKIINLEQDFKKEENNGDEDNKKENDDKRNNNKENNNKIDNNNNKNEVQGYYLNIINSKKVKREKNLDTANNNENNANSNNNLTSKENKTTEITNTNNSNTNLNNKRSFKISRSRELNLHDINSKNILLSKMNNYNNNLNNNSINSKTVNNYNDLSKRSHSLSEHQNEEKENNKNESTRNKYSNSKKIIVMNSVNNDNSPNHSAKNKKIANIPISKVKNFTGSTYNKTVYEKANNKEGNKTIIYKNKK